MLARGNVALSLTVSAVSTLLAIVMTPLGFFMWAGVNPVTSGLLRDISVDPIAIVTAAIYMLILPTVTAVALRQSYGYLVGRDPSVAFLYVLVAIKFLETRTARDGTVVRERAILFRHRARR